MKLQTKRILVLIAAVIALIGAIYCLLRFGFSIDVLDQSGWRYKNNAVQYKNYFGRPQTGWQYIDGRLYYFQPDTGNMVTGWQEIDKKYYYFGQNGVRSTGWLTIENTTYYLGEDGKILTGWQEIDGKNYLFSESGAMVTGWHTINGNRCYFSQEGMALTGWHTLDEKLYYFTDEGYTVSGTMELDGVRYHFVDDGSVLTGWFNDESGNYYLNEKGLPHTGWLELDGKRYYFDENGLQTSGWITDGDDRYYVYADGTTPTGRVIIEGTTHFFTSKGKWVLFCNPWIPVPQDYELKLVSIEGFRFDSAGRDSLQKMLDDCRDAGFSCTINNTYRSKATQQYMWDRSVAKYMATGMTRAEAEIETGKDTAPPGHSEHQTGLAVDLNGSEATYAWLAEHCWDYGFILRYPDEKIEITGIIYEPWHFRYVGTDLSLELKELGITLEEYIERLTPQTEEPTE